MVRLDGIVPTEIFSASGATPRGVEFSSNSGVDFLLAGSSLYSLGKPEPRNPNPESRIPNPEPRNPNPETRTPKP